MSLARAKQPGKYLGDGVGEQVGSGELRGTLIPLREVCPGEGDRGGVGLNVGEEGGSSADHSDVLVTWSEELLSAADVCRSIIMLVSGLGRGNLSLFYQQNYYVNNPDE